MKELGSHEPFQVMTDKIAIKTSASAGYTFSIDGINYYDGGTFEDEFNIMTGIPRGLYMMIDQPAIITEG